MKYATDVKVNAKPTSSNVIRSDWWGGPCHVSPREEGTPEYERRAGREWFKTWYEELRENLDLTRCDMVEPAYLEFSESFVVKDAELGKLTSEGHSADSCLIAYRIPGVERPKRPVSMTDFGPTPLSVASYYRQIGLDAYMTHDYEEHNRLLIYLQVKETVANTKILILSNVERVPTSVNTGCWDPAGLYKRYGIRNSRIDFRQVFNYLEKVTIDDDIHREAEPLLEQTDKADTTEKYLCNDLRYFHTVRNMTEEFEYNVLTIPCKELCTSHFLQQRELVPCMTHSLNKDDRTPSICEEDLAAWVAIMMMMYLIRQSVHMGNPVLISAEANNLGHLGTQKLLPRLGRTLDRDVLEIRHTVPMRKMCGYDQLGQDYESGYFTTQGWGTHYQVNMAEEDGQTMIMGHFNREGTKMIVAVGHTLGCKFRSVYYSPAVFYDIEGGTREFRHALVKGGYGHHQAIVYGNRVKELQELGEIVGLEVEVFR